MEIKEAVAILKEIENAKEVIDHYFRSNKIIDLIFNNMGDNIPHEYKNAFQFPTQDYEILNIDDDYINIQFSWYGSYQAEEHWEDRIPIQILENIPLGIELYMAAQLKKVEQMKKVKIKSEQEQLKRKIELYKKLKEELGDANA